MKSSTLGYTQVTNLNLPIQAKVDMSQERRERLSGSTTQVLGAASVKPVYDTMTVEVEKTQVRIIFNHIQSNEDSKHIKSNLYYFQFKLLLIIIQS